MHTCKHMVENPSFRCIWCWQPALCFLKSTLIIIEICQFDMATEYVSSVLMGLSYEPTRPTTSFIVRALQRFNYSLEDITPAQAATELYVYQRPSNQLQRVVSVWLEYRTDEDVWEFSIWHQPSPANRPARYDTWAPFDSFSEQHMQQRNDCCHKLMDAVCRTLNDMTRSPEARANPGRLLNGSVMKDIAMQLSLLTLGHAREKWLREQRGIAGVQAWRGGQSEERWATFRSQLRFLEETQGGGSLSEFLEAQARGELDA